MAAISGGGSGSVHVVTAPILLSESVAADTLSDPNDNVIAVQDSSTMFALLCKTFSMTAARKKTTLPATGVANSEVQGPVTKLSRPGIVHGRSRSAEGCRLHEDDFGKGWSLLNGLLGATVQSRNSNQDRPIRFVPVVF